MSDKRFEHRKSHLTLKLTHADGTPVANQPVEINQTRHQFLFGTTGFDVLELAGGKTDGTDITPERKEFLQARMDKLLAFNNFFTLPFYLGRYEPEEGNPDFRRMMAAAKWFAERGVYLKGHPLCWHTVCAPWLMKYSNKEILRKQLERIERDVSAYRGVVDVWDVINEVVIMPIFDKYDNGITRICKDLGRIQLIREVFAEARKANPNAVLLINDFNTSESYDILIEGLIHSGIAIEAIGIQSHMHQGYWGVEKTQEILERFSRFKLPIHFTENSLVSGHIMPLEIDDLNDYKIDQWPSTPEGEERQAVEAELHYKTLFAHPLVESVTWWSFLDGGWLGAPSGLLTKEGNKKPIYDRLHKLIKEDWWTSEQQLITNERGVLTLSGYLGDYSATFEGNDKNFTLMENKEIIRIKFEPKALI